MLLHAKLFYPLHMFDVTFHTVAFVHVHARSYFFLGSYYLRTVLTFSCFLFVKYSYVHLLVFFFYMFLVLYFFFQCRDRYTWFSLSVVSSVIAWSSQAMQFFSCVIRSARILKCWCLRVICPLSIQYFENCWFECVWIYKRLNILKHDVFISLSPGSKWLDSPDFS